MSPDVGKPGEGESKFNELLEEIKAAGTSYTAETEAEGPDGIIDKKPILEAIFCKRLKGELNAQEAFVLAGRWIMQIRDSVGKIFLVSNLVHLKIIGLLENQRDIDEIVKLLRLSEEDQDLMADELLQLGIQPVLTSKPPAWSPTALKPESARATTQGWPGTVRPSSRPPIAAPADTDTEEHDPRGFVQKHAKRIGVGIAAAAALALGTSSVSLWKGSEDNPASPPEAATSEVAGSPEPTPPQTKMASLAPTVAPLTTPTPPAPIQEAPVAKVPTPTAPAPTPVAPKIAAKAEKPATPETPKTANFPIITRQNALGATFIDLEASRSQWESDGWKVEPFVSPDGNKGVRLTKDGKTARIGNLRIAAGIEVLGLNLD